MYTVRETKKRNELRRARKLLSLARQAGAGDESAARKLAVKENDAEYRSRMAIAIKSRARRDFKMRAQMVASIISDMWFHTSRLNPLNRIK